MAEEDDTESQIATDFPLICLWEFKSVESNAGFPGSSHFVPLRLFCWCLAGRGPRAAARGLCSPLRPLLLRREPLALESTEPVSCV